MSAILQPETANKKLKKDTYISDNDYSVINGWLTIPRDINRSIVRCPLLTNLT